MIRMGIWVNRIDLMRMKFDYDKAYYILVIW